MWILFKPEVLAPSASVYVGNGVDADLKQAFTWAIAHRETDPSAASVLVVNKLNDVSEDVLRKIFESNSENYLVCVVNPVKAELDAFVKSHDWITMNTENINDSTFIYGFNGARRNYYISLPANCEGDPVLKNIYCAQNYYLYLSGTLSDYASHLKIDSGSDKDSDVDKMEDFANFNHISETHPFSVHRRFRELPLSDPDYLDGNCSVTVNYDIYMVHIYDGEPGAGDYYGVRMTASIANAGMWKGKGWNVHGGCYVRWCGWWNKNFIVEARLNNANMVEVPNIGFTAGGFPSPATTVGKTTYQDVNNFSLSMSQTIGGEIGTGSGQGSMGGKAELSFSQGWTWSHSENRTISDLDIINETSGSRPRWQLTCQNLPEFNWNEDYGFKISNSKVYRGTISVQGSWLWYDKNGRDNMNHIPYYLYTTYTAGYTMQNFLTTWADLQEENVSFSCAHKTQLPKMINITSGGLVLVNNLKDDAAISNIQVCDAKTGRVYSVFKNTVPNGGEQLLGHFKTSGSYVVNFRACVPGKQFKEYVYITNPSIEVENKSTTKLYALNDFKMR